MSDRTRRCPPAGSGPRPRGRSQFRRQVGHRGPGSRHMASRGQVLGDRARPGRPSAPPARAVTRAIRSRVSAPLGPGPCPWVRGIRADNGPPPPRQAHRSSSAMAAQSSTAPRPARGRGIHEAGCEPTRLDQHRHLEGNEAHVRGWAVVSAARQLPSPAAVTNRKEFLHLHDGLPGPGPPAESAAPPPPGRGSAWPGLPSRTGARRPSAGQARARRPDDQTVTGSVPPPC